MPLYTESIEQCFCDAPQMYSQSVTVPFYNSTSTVQPFHVGLMASIIEQHGSPATSQERTKEKTKKWQCRSIGSNCPMKADPHCTRRVHYLMHLSVPLNYNDYQSNEESRCRCLMTSTRQQWTELGIIKRLKLQVVLKAKNSMRPDQLVRTMCCPLSLSFWLGNAA